MTPDQVKSLERLFEITRGLSASVDLETYIQSILSAAIELTGSESASLLEYDEAAQEFSFKFAPWFHREAASSAKIPLNESFTGWVFLNVRPLVIDDLSKDDRHYEKMDDLSRFKTTSVLGVPLTVHGRPVGVFEVFNKKEPYSGEDILILETLASLAATAIQNDMLEKNIFSTQEEARELDKLKNEFIAITSHELRTPLGLILGHATFLRELTGNEYGEQVDAIIRNATRLKEIIESLSSVNNYESGGSLIRSHRVSVARIIDDVSASFHEMAKSKGIALKTEVKPGQELWVDIDGGKIAIVLSNLLKNAVTFTNEGGHVLVRGEQQPDYISVSVQDNGLGVPSRDLPRIFDRFYQVESHLTRRHGGMGLGLSVAKVMIEMHGGRIWAESQEGHGSTFTFLLPVNKKSEPESTSPFVE